MEQLFGSSAKGPEKDNPQALAVQTACGDGVLQYLSLGFFKSIANIPTAAENSPFSLLVSPRNISSIKTRSLVCWGPTDILSLSVCDSPESFLEIQKACPATTSVYENSYAFGAVIQPAKLDLAVMDELPLVGVSLMKFDQRLHNGVDGKKALDLLKDGVWKIVQKYLQSTPDVKATLALSYGWEDLILLVFAKRYDAIKHLIFTLRKELKFEALKFFLSPAFASRMANTCPKPIHAIATTHTTIALAVPNSAGYTVDANIDRLCKILDPADHTRVKRVAFQVRPGHVDWVKKNIPPPPAEYCPQFEYCIGRYDVALIFNTMPIQDFARYYFAQLSPKLAEPTSPILGVQSLFFLPDEGKEEEESQECNQLIETFPLPPADRALVDHIENGLALPTHARTALISTIQSSWYLRNSFFIKAGMESLVRAIDAVKRAIETGSNYTVATDDILPLLEECFQDRFRGSYPLGEGFATPLISYKGSFHKHLIFIDWACHHIFESIRHSIADWSGDRLSKHAFCSFLSSLTSPAIKPFGLYGYNLAIAWIPLDSLFTTRDLYYLFHEIGHVVQNALDLRGETLERLMAFLEADSMKGGLTLRKAVEAGRCVEQVFEILEDLVSDYIMLVVGFDGDLNAFTEYVKYYFAKLRCTEQDEGLDPSDIFRILVVGAFPSPLTKQDLMRSQLESVEQEWKEVIAAAALEKIDVPEFYSITLSFLRDLVSSSEDSDVVSFLREMAKYPKLVKNLGHLDKVKQIRAYFDTRRLADWAELLYG